jgi:protein phosphatase
MVREGNEDSLFHGTTTFAVADGMGGHQAGEVASATALEPLTNLDGREFATAHEATAALCEAVVAANTSVFEKAAVDPELRGMGTTLTALLVREGRFHLAHVGDSRAYLLRAGEPMSRLTTDHTLVQQLIDEGRLSSDEADTHPQRSVITRAIGVDRSVEVDTLSPLQTLSGDQILLCSDGLTGPVKEEEIADILLDHADGQEACQALIDAANAAGGPDNITVVLLRVEDDPPPPPSNATRSETQPETAAVSPERSRSGDTEELAPPSAETAPGVLGPGLVTKIRTRVQDAEEFDAEKFGHYGGRLRADGAPSPGSAGRWRRIFASATVVLLALSTVALGSWLLISRAYFVADHAGTVAIFRGLPQQVGGLQLSRMVTPTTVRTGDLPPFLQAQLRGGITQPDLAAARQYVDVLLAPKAAEAERARREAERARREAERARREAERQLSEQPGPIPAPGPPLGEASGSVPLPVPGQPLVAR